jgi:hypothetical protein
MFQQYVRLCEAGQLEVGKLWLYKSPDRWVLNFPTKKDWKWPSKEEYLRRGLEKFVQTYLSRGIESVAFPLLGAHNGGLTESESMNVMLEYLQHCDIPVEIYRYDRLATDDLYSEFKSIVLSSSIEQLQTRTGLRRQYIDRIREAVMSRDIVQLNQLASQRGIGDKTLEAAFALMRAGTAQKDESQQSLEL